MLQATGSEGAAQQSRTGTMTAHPCLTLPALTPEGIAYIRRRNERERERVRCVNDHYECLRRHIPHHFLQAAYGDSQALEERELEVSSKRGSRGGRGRGSRGRGRGGLAQYNRMRRISKVEVLHAAIDYICALDGMLSRNDNVDLSHRQHQQPSNSFIRSSTTTSELGVIGGMSSDCFVGHHHYGGYDRHFSGSFGVDVCHTVHPDQINLDNYNEETSGLTARGQHHHRQSEAEHLYTPPAAQSATFSHLHYEETAKEKPNSPAHARHTGNLSNAKDVLSSRLYQRLCRQRAHSSSVNNGIDVAGAEEIKDTDQSKSFGQQLVWPTVQQFAERYYNYSN